MRSPGGAQLLEHRKLQWRDGNHSRTQVSAHAVVYSSGITCTNYGSLLVSMRNKIVVAIYHVYMEIIYCCMQSWEYIVFVSKCSVCFGYVLNYVLSHIQITKIVN